MAPSGGPGGNYTPGGGQGVNPPEAEAFQQKNKT